MPTAPGKPAPPQRPLTRRDREEQRRQVESCLPDYDFDEFLSEKGW